MLFNSVTKLSDVSTRHSLSKTPRLWTILLVCIAGLVASSGVAMGQAAIATEEWSHTHRGTDIGRAGFELANVDGGGFPDLVATAGFDAQDDSNRYWYVMNGRTFDVLATGAFYDRLDILEVLDTDGDGRDDILVGADDHVETWRWNVTWGRLDLEQSIAIPGPTEILGVHWADIDVDGSAEILVTDEFTLWIFDAASSALEATLSGFGRGAVTTGQLDADPQLEIVGGGDPWGNPGFVLDGASLALEWEDIDMIGRKLSTVDLTGDGFDEIVGIGGNYPVRVLDPTIQGDLWFPGWWQSDAGRLVDSDGDGNLEVVSSDRFNNQIYVYDAATGTQEDTIVLTEHHATGLVAGDLHASPGIELAWADTISNGTLDWLRMYDVANDVVLLQTEDVRGPSGFGAGAVDASGETRLVETVHGAETEGERHRIFDLNGFEVSTAPATSGYVSVEALAVADILGDSRAEILHAAGLDPYQQVQAYDDAGNGLWSAPTQWSDHAAIRAIEVADLDGDSDLEVVFVADSTDYVYDGGVFVLDATTGDEIWSDPYISALNGPLSHLRVANVDGDPQLEILVGEEGGGLRIWDGLSLTLQYNGASPSLLSALDTPDRDGDGTAEIIVGDQSGTLAVYDASGSLVETITTLPDAIQGLQVLDLSNEGTADYAFVSAGQLQILLGEGGSVEAVIDVGLDEAGTRDGVRAGDYDGDGYVEVWVDRGFPGTVFYEVRAVIGEVPTVTIREPGDFEPTYCYLQPELCQFAAEAEALDFEDFQIYFGQWYSSIEGALLNKDGNPLDYYVEYPVLTVAGSHEISFVVVDSDGNYASGSVDVDVFEQNLAPPVVTIHSPAEGAVIYEGQIVQFDATAIDPEAGDIGSQIAWFARPSNNLLWEGSTFETSNLPVGTTSIEASAWDWDLEGFSSINVSVLADPPPEVTISSPADGTSVVEGTSLDFTGAATDLEDGDLSASLDWQSDLQGSIGAGGSFSSAFLVVGTHTITASATDSRSQVGSESITVTVTPNTVPTVAISAPSNGSDSMETDPIGFVATASDIEDGDLTASIAWSSNLDGALGTGGSINVSTLSVGSHTITATVTDSHGDSGSDSIQVFVDANEVPVVSISTPADSSTYTETDPISFTASATDAEEGDLTAGIDWSSDLDGALGTGGSINVSTLSVGTHVVTASVTDSYGETGSDTVTVIVEANSAPTVSIIEPPGPVTVTETDPVLLEATASDDEDGDLTASLAWSSDLDGALGTGGSITVSTLSIGNHVITASVTDSHGDSGSDSVAVTVEANNAPTVAISLPTEGSTAIESDTVNFGATASDTEDGDLSADVVWTSDLDGALHTGASFSSTTLSVGTHTITATVTDIHGGSGSDSVNITVNANNAPTVNITAPANGSSSTETDPVGFAATATDVEDGSLTASLAWSSSLDGAIGSGGSFSLMTLSVGTHTITATVTDGHGDSGSDSVTITVNVNTAPVVAIGSPANGSSATEGNLVSFGGSASDAQDGDLTASLVWTSNLDGAIGAGGSFGTTGLSVGTHTITASVTDSHGAPAQDQISLMVTPAPVQVVLTSIASEDGWVLEKRENGDFGDDFDASGSGNQAIRLGDDNKDKQYRAILSFDTSSIPAGVPILSAQVRVRRGAVVGSNPFGTLGNLVADVKTGGFGGSTALTSSDFEAAADVTASATLSNPVADLDWSEGLLDASGIAAIDVNGTTQLRLTFQVDDNDDRSNDYLGFYSGEATAGNQPELVIVYQP